MLRIIRHLAYVMCTLTILTVVLGTSFWVLMIYSLAGIRFSLDPFIFFAFLLYIAVKVESFYRPYLKPWTIK
jgi:hypothetical protein